MKLHNIRQDSVNAITTQNDKGETYALYNHDGSDITRHQLETMKERKTIDAAHCVGLKWVKRD